MEWLEVRIIANKTVVQKNGVETLHDNRNVLGKKKTFAFFAAGWIDELIIIVTFSASGTSFPGSLEIMNEKKHELGVSRLVTSHFHLKIAEQSGETDKF